MIFTKNGRDAYYSLDTYHAKILPSIIYQGLLRVAIRECYIRWARNLQSNFLSIQVFLQSTSVRCDDYYAQ